MDMDKRAEYVQGLRDVADFLEAHDTLPLPGGEFTAYTFEQAETLPIVQEIAKQLGSFKKRELNGYLTLEKSFGPIALCFTHSQEDTCRRIVIGTRKVEKIIYPEGIKTETKTIEEEIVEWKCPSLFNPES